MSHITPTVSIFSGKGGVGKTFVSLHLARGLAEAGMRTVLIDLDLHSGGALATVLGVRPLFHLLDTNRIHPEKISVPISPNLSLVSPPFRLDEILRAQRRDLTGFLLPILNRFDCAVVDLSHRLDLATVSALSLSHWVWLVTTDHPLAYHGTELMIKRLSGLGLEKERLRLILNGGRHYPTEWSGLTTYVLPYDRSAEGFPMVDGVYSQVCMERLKWFLCEELGWERARKDLLQAASVRERSARSRSITQA